MFDDTRLVDGRTESVGMPRSAKDILTKRVDIPGIKMTLVSGYPWPNI